MYRLSKAIAGLVVGLQRLDALVFTGGIGENSAVVRGLVPVPGAVPWVSARMG